MGPLHFAKPNGEVALALANDGGVSALAPYPLSQRLDAAATSPFAAFAENGEDLIVTTLARPMRAAHEP